MKNRKRVYILSMVAISVLFIRSFPKIDISTWSFILMTEEETKFLRTWCRLQRLQLDVSDRLGPCRSCIQGDSPRSVMCDRKPGDTTDVKYSYVSSRDIHAAGDFSRLFIKARNSSDHERSSGGDSWKVFLQGPSFLSASVFDLSNGTYEVIFLPVLPGRYHVDIILVDSMCRGIKDPTESYSDLGKFGYYIDIPAPEDDGVLHRLQYHMKFRDQLRLSVFKYHWRYGYCANCNFLWNGYGTWENERGKLKWRPYIKIDDKPKKVKYRKHAIRKNGTLWFYGDMHSKIYRSVTGRPLCEKIFKKCENAADLYPKNDLTGMENVDHIAKLVLTNLRTLITNCLQQPEDALILNSGFIGQLPYRSYVVVIDKMARLLRESWNTSTHAQIVWSTMTSSPGRHDNLHYPVYNAYANRKMCESKIPILDLFPLTDSFPHSSSNNKLKSNFTFESVERLLEDFFERTTDR